MKRSNLFLLALTFVVLLVSYCTPQQEMQLDEAKMEQGFTLLETTCYTCHSPQNEDVKGGKVAPPMFAVKSHYSEDGLEEEEFIELWKNYLNNPVEENTRMPGAVKKFGLMPNLGLSEEQIDAVAYYVFNTEIESPEWFKEHYQSQRDKYFKEPSADNMSDLELGKQYVLKTKSALGSNLMSVLKTEGSIGALEYCNLNAKGLLDSMQQELGVSIKRVSDKNRNPDNAANLDELEYIMKARHTLQDKSELKPKLIENREKLVAYYPIVTNKMCMQCHGEEGIEIEPKTLAKIKELYPEDKATGYGINQLRGIWVVEMDKE
jgi:cytochrome c553